MKAVMFAVAASALALAGAASAQDDAAKLGKGSFVVSVRGTGVLPEASDPILTKANAATGLHVDVKNDYKPTLGFTYFLTDHVAVEAILGTTQHKIYAKGPATDVEVHQTWVLPPIVTAQYHFAPDAAVRPYVGAGVNAMIFYGGDDKNGFKVKLDNGLGYALQAGAFVPLKGRWMLNADVKKVWFKTDAGINSGALKSEVNLDPWVVSLGVSRVF